MSYFTYQALRAIASNRIKQSCVIHGSNVNRSISLLAMFADESFVDLRFAPPDWTAGAATVYPAFCSVQEQEAIVEVLKERLKRKRYQAGHWDAVIVKYKEIELLDECDVSTELHSVLNRIRAQCEIRHLPRSDVATTWLPAHAIDLPGDGELKAHVDSVRFSGRLVAGLSLQSSSIMRLRPPAAEDGDRSVGKGGYENAPSPAPDEDGFVDLHLPPCSLYVLQGVARYKYSHELLPNGSTFGNDSIVVDRGHRLSVIVRDAKAEDVRYQ